MSQKEDLFVYDEQDAVKFIMKQLPAEVKKNVSEDAVYYVIDCMYDYYEANGLMDESMDEDAVAEIIEDDLVASVLAAVRKDAEMKKLTEEEVRSIVEGELAYCDSLDMFE